MQADEMMRAHKALFWIAVAIAIYAVVSFGGLALLSEGRRARYGLLVSSHGVLVLGWYVLVALQARLAASGKWAVHRILGRLSVIHVAAMVIASGFVTWHFVAEFGRRGTGAGDILILITFLILFGGALIAARRRAIEWHVRFMLGASIAMTSPAHARFLDLVGLPREATILLVVLTYLAVPIGFDLVTRRKIHRATHAVMAILFVMLVISIVAFVQLEGF